MAGRRVHERHGRQVDDQHVGMQHERIRNRCLQRGDRARVDLTVGTDHRWRSRRVASGHCWSALHQRLYGNAGQHPDSFALTRRRSGVRDPQRPRANEQLRTVQYPTEERRDFRSRQSRNRSRSERSSHPRVIRRSGALVREWTTESTHPAVPATVVHGHAAFEWPEGERFPMWRQQD